MGAGKMGMPPKGPKIGPTKDISEVSAEKREELGDIEKLKVLADPGQPPPATADGEGAVDPSAETQVLARSEEGAERLEAMRAVLDAEEPEPNALDEEAAPTDEDRREFMRCILGDQVYGKEYDLFGGLIRLKMRDLTPKQVDTVFTQMTIAQKKGKIETEDDWELTLDRFRLVAGTEALLWAGKELLGPFDFKKGLYEASESLLQSFKNATIYRALLRVVRVFHRHLAILMERATDSDFWADDGPDSPSAPISEEPSTTQDDRPSDGNSKKGSSSDS